MKLKAFIISVVSLVIVAVVSIALYVNWNAIKGTIDESKYYTSEDLQNSYDNGFSDGSKSETELTAQVAYFKGIVDEYYLTIVDLQKKNENLQLSNNNLSSTVSELENLKTENEQTIENLQITISDNEELISSYKSQIASLNNQISILQNSNVNAQSEIDSLKKQVANYQSMVAQLQNTNDMNVQTINSLNAQISSLNTQISELKYEIANNSSNVAELEKQILDLQKSITYYETYIAELETETQVVATFEFDGSVYNIQILDKGSKISVATPSSTGKCVFNGWTVNGEIVDLTTYTITENTKFVADVTYKNVVSFISDGVSIDEQYIVDGEFASAPMTSKDGYEFDGWTVDGNTIVDVSTYEITSDTTFTAVYTQLHTVTFLYEDEIVSTQTIRNGAYAENVSIENTTYKTFNGWTVHGAIVDVSTYKVSSAMTFVADITYSYDVTFVVDGETVDSQIVIENGYAIAPETPVKESYSFDGWTIDGEIIDLTTYSITENVTFVASFTYKPYGLFSEDGSIIMSWQELLDNDYLIETNGVLSKGSKVTELSGCLNIADSVTSIGDYTFFNCDSLLEVEMPNSVISIGARVFAYSDNLSVIKLSDSITSIGYFAFAGTSISEISLPPKITILDNYLFSNCKNLLFVSIPTGVTTFGSCVFDSCSALRAVYVPDTLTNWPSSSYDSVFMNCSSALVVYFEATDMSSANILLGDLGTSVDGSPYVGYVHDIKDFKIINNCIYFYNSSNDCLLGAVLDYDIETFTIAENVNIISKNAFYFCSNLNSIVIGSNVHTFSEYAFNNCSSLENIFYQNGSSLNKIYFAAFNGCSSLKTLFIPSSVTYIYSSSSGGAFYGSSLENVYVTWVDSYSRPADVGYYWACIATSLYPNIHYNYTYEQYIAETGATA